MAEVEWLVITINVAHNIMRIRQHSMCLIGVYDRLFKDKDMKSVWYESKLDITSRHNLEIPGTYDKQDTNLVDDPS